MYETAQTMLPIIAKRQLLHINILCREQTMEEATNARQPVGPTLHRCAPENVLFHIPLCAADAARSTKNIELWKSYLPTPCVRTMIRMGWDYTT